MKEKQSLRSPKATETHMTQRELLALLKTSPEQGMEALFYQYWGYCYRIAYEILHCREDAEECVDDVLLQAGKALREGIPRCLRTYLAATARNQAITRYRREHCEKRGGLRYSSPLRESFCRGTAVLEEDVCGGMVIRQCLEEVLHACAPWDRRLFLRRYEDGLSISALAAEFSLSEACVRSRLFRMRDRLRRELCRYGVTL